MTLLLVSCLGFLLSLGWYLVNRGSKYWQENWERHVDLLESKAIGPLYKTTISRQEFPVIKFWGGYPYSVTKINQLISFFVMLVWLGLVIGAFPKLPRRDNLLSLVPRLLVGLTLLFSVFPLTLGRGGSEGKPRRINFRESPLQSTKSENVQTEAAPIHAGREKVTFFRAVTSSSLVACVSNFPIGLTFARGHNRFAGCRTLASFARVRFLTSSLSPFRFSPRLHARSEI